MMKRFPKKVRVLSLGVVLLTSAGAILVIRGFEVGDRESSPQFAWPPGLTAGGDLLWGMPNRDLFPTVDSPRFIDPETAEAFLRDDDLIYHVKKGDVCYAFPEVLLTTYHIVNAVIDEEPVAVTYCLLSGSACRFSRKVGDDVLTFGATGQLYAGNSVIYDRETGTDWLQMNGEPLDGPLYGQARLGTEPMESSTWGAIKKEGHVKVLAPLEDMEEYRSFREDMDREKLGQRAVEESRRLDRRLPPYTEGVGIRVREAKRFYPIEKVVPRRIINDELGGWSILVACGSDGRTRVFRRMQSGRRLEFVLDGEVLKDRQTGSTWSDGAACIAGPLAGARLDSPSFSRVYWFVWSSIYPDTDVL